MIGFSNKEKGFVPESQGERKQALAELKTCRGLSRPIFKSFEEERILKFYLEEKEAVLRELGSAAEGLTNEEAAARLEKNGKNKLKEEKKDGLVKRFFKQMADPMIIILLVAAVISATVSYYQGESIADAYIILAVVIINAVLGVYQENKAEKAIEALQKMSAMKSRVLRDGRIVEINSEDIVVGDICILEAGDAIPADGRLLEAQSLKAEESALTGESVAVSKVISALSLEDKKDITLGDRRNMVYMGSTIAYGRGVAVITATGMDTEVGKIAEAIQATSEGKTPLQKKLSELSSLLTKLVLAICVIIFGVQIWRAGGFDFETAIEAFMISVSLAVAAIPEGLVAVVTIVLSVGVTRMSEQNAIIRKLTAVETLGCSEIICSDKTGTLTLNKMTVTKEFSKDKERLATAMSLASDAENGEDGMAIGEPTECALVNYANSLGLDKDELKRKAPRIGEAPFDSNRKMMSTVHRRADGIIQYTKGAPDEILKKCTSFFDGENPVPMTDELREEILAQNKIMADGALRVLAAAQRVWESEPESYEPGDLEKELCFLGLCGMIDPVRPEVKDAIKTARGAGITPIMITGDHKLTAMAIARELEMLGDDNLAIEGAELEEMSDEKFKELLPKIAVYARVQPEHKTRIVSAWQERNKVTAMTGDGVNDAPSIKKADIGIGMGITGTDVTKNVADMVLTDDNFATIVKAVAEGRHIYDNIRKAIIFLLGSNLSEVISIFVATLAGFIILRPVHLLWINLVTDSFPALALGVENSEADIMNRPPRKADEGLFSGGVGFAVAYQGFTIAILTLLSYFMGHYMDTGVFEVAASEHGITMAFLTLSFSEIFHSFNMRDLKRSIFQIKDINKSLLLAAVASILSTTAVCEIPFLSELFGIVPVSWAQYGVAAGIAFLIIPIVETVKFIKRATEKPVQV